MAYSCAVTYRRVQVEERHRQISFRTGVGIDKTTTVQYSTIKGNAELQRCAFLELEQAVIE